MTTNTKTRQQLKSYFVKNAIPTEGNFADLIDAPLNQRDDGVFKQPGEPLGVVAAPGPQRRALRFYAPDAQEPDWIVSLSPTQNPADPATARQGLGLTTAAGVPRLFLDLATGHLGLGTNNPGAHRLQVEGDARVNGALTTTGALTVGGLLTTSSGLTVGTPQSPQNLSVSGAVSVSGRLDVGAVNATQDLVVRGRIGINITTPAPQGEFEVVTGGDGGLDRVLIRRLSYWDSVSTHATIGGCMHFDPYVPWIPWQSRASIRYGLSGGKAPGVYWDVGTRDGNAFSFAVNGTDHHLWLLSNGSLGIGTNNPGTNRLQVEGNTRVTGTLTTTGATTSGGLLTASAGLSVAGTLTTTGATTSGGLLTASAGLSVTGTLATTGATTSGGLLTAQAGLNVTGILSTSGNVGLGTANPGTNRLQVEGNTQLGGTLTTTGATTSGGLLTANGHFVVPNGNVGIGTANSGTNRLQVEGLTRINGNLGLGADPGVNRLHVEGNARITGSLGVTAGITADGGVTITGGNNLAFAGPLRQMLNLAGAGAGLGVQTNTLYLRSPNHFALFQGGIHNDIDLTPGTGGSAVFVVNAGNVGIGTSTPGARLDVSGTARIGGTLNTTGVLTAGARIDANAGITVLGATSLAALSTSGAVTVGTPQSPQNLTVNGTLNAGATTLASLSVAGTFSPAALSTTGAVTVGTPQSPQNLTVHGNTSLAALSLRGLVSPASDKAIGLVAAQDPNLNLLRLHRNANEEPDWLINLNPDEDQQMNEGGPRRGFGLTNVTGIPRLFVDYEKGYVGIGTNNPAFRLHVEGDLLARSALISGTLQAAGLSLSGGMSVMSITATGNLAFSGPTSQRINLNGPNYGIGLQNSTTYLRSFRHFALFQGGTHDSNDLAPGTGGSAVFVVNNGNVGIGTTTPSTRLHVVGDATISNILDLSGNARQMLRLSSDSFGIGVQNNTLYLRSPRNFAFYHNGAHSDTELAPGTNGSAAVVIANGNVGVGTTTPNARFHVEGNTRLNGGVTVPPGRLLAATDVSLGAPRRWGVRLFRSFAQCVLNPSIPNTISLATGMTVQAWVYASSTISEQRTIIELGNPTVDSLHISVGTDGSVSVANLRGATTPTVTSLANSVPINTWIHVGVTVDGSGNCTLFLNGGVAASGSFGVAPSTGSRSILLGRRTTATSGYWDGLLSEVSVAVGVRSISLQPLASNADGLIGYWRLDADAQDSCSNASKLGQGSLTGSGTSPGFEATSGSSLVTITAEDWIVPTLLNSFVAAETLTYNPPGFFKDPFGVVHFRGYISNNTANFIDVALPGVALFDLPVGYRPQNTEVHTTPCAAGTLSRIDIRRDGRVFMARGHGTFTSLDGITFRAFR